MKNFKKIKRAVCAFLAAVMMASVAGCSISKKSQGNGGVQSRQIVNYFTSEDFDIPEEMSYTEDIFYANNQLYVSGEAGGEKAESYACVYNPSSKEYNEFNLCNLGFNYMTNYFYNGDVSYICYSDKDTYSMHIGVYDNKTGQIKESIDIGGDSYPSSMEIDKNGDLRAFINVWGMNGASTKCVTYDPLTLEEKSSVNISEKASFGKEEMITMNVTSEDGFLYILTYEYDFENDEMKMKLHKLSENYDVVYTLDDFSDMEGEPSYLFIRENGNVCVATTEDYELYYINELDHESGAVVKRYEAEFKEENVSFCQNYKHEGSDFVYKTYEGIYGYSLEKAEATKIASFGDVIPEKMSESYMLYGYNDSLVIYTEVYGEYGKQFFVYDADGNITDTISLEVDEEEYVYYSAVLPDGSICYVAEYGEDTGDSYVSRYRLYFADETGKVTGKTELSNIGGENSYIENFYVGENGKIFVYSARYDDETGEQNAVIGVYDNEGKEICTIDCDIEGMYISNIISGKSGDYIIYSSAEENQTAAKLDCEKGAIGEKCDLSLPMNSYVIRGDGRYDIYYMTNEGVYGKNIKDKEGTEIINWIDSDMNSNIEAVAIAGEDDIYCLSADYDNGDYTINKLKRADEETLKAVQNKKIITIACYGLYDSEMYERISEFNKSNDTYRIKINDYDKYTEFEDDTYRSGTFRLNDDITSGNIPDVIMGGYELDMASYAAKGVLTDLNQFLDKDDEISKDRYFENIFSLNSKDGKLYQITPSFNISALTGATSVVGSETKWNFDEFFKFTEKGNTFYKLPKESLASNMIKENLAEFVDFDNKTCDFNNDNFIRLLELVEKEGVEEPDKDQLMRDNNAEEEYPRRFVDGKCRLEFLYMYGFEQLLGLQQGEISEEVTIKGFPSENGSGISVMTSSAFGICEKSKNKEGAWQFIRQFLLEDYQDSLVENRSYTFPLMKSSYEKLENKAMSGENSGYKIITPDGDYVEMKPLDEKTAEKVRKAIELADRTIVSDERITEILDEQFTEFFAGASTASETAETIQKKVSLYLKEIK